MTPGRALANAVRRVHVGDGPSIRICREAWSEPDPRHRSRAPGAADAGEVKDQRRYRGTLNSPKERSQLPSEAISKLERRTGSRQRASRATAVGCSVWGVRCL